VNNVSARAAGGASAPATTRASVPGDRHTSSSSVYGNESERDVVGRKTAHGCSKNGASVGQLGILKGILDVVSRMGQHASTPSNNQSMVRSTTESTMTRQPSNPHETPLPRARIVLPPLSADYALTLADILDDIVTAIWEAHGDRMVDLLALRGVETPRPWGAGWECPNPNAGDDDDVPF